MQIKSISEDDQEEDKALEQEKRIEKNIAASKPTLLKFIFFDVLINLAAFGAHVADVGTDISVAVFYYRTGKTWWFALTMAFILLAIVVTVTVRLYYYNEDMDYQPDNPIYSSRRIVIVVFCVLGLPLFPR